MKFREGFFMLFYKKMKSCPIAKILLRFEAENEPLRFKVKKSVISKQSYENSFGKFRKINKTI